jgi:hypothetical protein
MFVTVILTKSKFYNFVNSQSIHTEKHVSLYAKKENLQILRKLKYLDLFSKKNKN